MPSPGPSAGRGPTQSGRAARPSALAAGTARLAPAPLGRGVHTWSLSLLLSVAFSPPPSAACTYPTGGEEGLTPSSPGQQLLSTEGESLAWPSTTKIHCSGPGKHIPLDKAGPQLGLPRSPWGHSSHQAGLGDMCSHHSQAAGCEMSRQASSPWDMEVLGAAAGICSMARSSSILHPEMMPTLGQHSQHVTGPGMGFEGAGGSHQPAVVLEL